MTVLLLSADDEAAGALSRALERAGIAAEHLSTLPAARLTAERTAPRVIVADTAVSGYEQLLAESRRARPWTRVLLMADASAEPPDRSLPAVFKPFDAAELVILLSRELELAELDRGRRDLARELEHSERLAAIGRLSASMAHEINNPLAVIFACGAYVAELAERNQEIELAEVARDVELAAQRIGSFVEHVCGYGRRSRSDLIDSPISVAVDMAVRMLKPRIKSRGVELQVEPIPTLYTVQDPARLAQAVANILSNAVDAAGEAGGHVWLSVAEDGGTIVIRVDDDGRGLDAAIADKAFEPFVTSKPHGQGTGLGLAITRQIMEDHAGSASLSNRTQGGARAELRIPMLDPSQHLVLVVERDPSLRRALEVELRRAGFSVVAISGLGAVAESVGPRAVAVAICDQHLCDELRSVTPGAKLVCISDDPQAGVQADRLLPKPWQRDRLISAVRELCVRRPSVAAMLTRNCP